MRTKVELQQGSDEWLAFRKNHLGSSDAAALMGVSPWLSPYKLWLEKQGLYTVPMNPAMQHGVNMEETAREAASKVLGVELRPAVFVSVEHPFMMASLDAWNEEAKVLVEIKCPLSENVFARFRDTEEIPCHYIMQLDHMLLVMGLQSCFFAMYYDGNLKMTQHKLSPSWESLLNAELRFWASLKALEAPESDELALELVSGQEALESRLVAAKRALKEAEQAFEAAKKEAVELAGGRCIQFGAVKVVLRTRKGNIEYKAIPELRNVDLEKYRKKSTEWWEVSI